MDKLDGAQGAARFAEPSDRERPPAAAPAVLTCPGYGNEIRWRDGERLEHLFEACCDELRASGQADHPAVDAGDVVLSYGHLDARANRLARHLLARGTRPGDRVALLLDQPVHAYVAMLARSEEHTSELQ